MKIRTDDRIQLNKISYIDDDGRTKHFSCTAKKLGADEIDEAKHDDAWLIDEIQIGDIKGLRIEIENEQGEIERTLTCEENQAEIAQIIKKDLVLRSTVIHAYFDNFKSRIPRKSGRRGG